MLPSSFSQARFRGVLLSHRLCFGCAPPTASLCNGEAAGSMNLFFPSRLSPAAKRRHRLPCIMHPSVNRLLSDGWKIVEG